MIYDRTCNLEDFYSFLESSAQFERIITYDSSRINFSDYEQSVIHTELSILHGYILNDLSNISNNEVKGNIVRYLKRRIENTQNTFLIAKYNQTLWELCKNNNYAIISINSYRDLVKKYVDDKSVHRSESIIGKIWNTILQISGGIKKEAPWPEIEQELISLLKDNTNSIKLRYWLIYYIRQNYECCKSMQLSFIPDFCMEILNVINDYNWTKNFIECGIFFAERFKKSLLPLFYERLGDNEEKIIKDSNVEPDNILIPHANHSIYQKMLHYYALSKNKIKYNRIAEKYTENKNKLKYIPIAEKMKITPEMKNYINEYVKDIEESTTEEAIFLLTIHNDIFFIPSEILHKLCKSANDNKYLHTRLFNAVQMDLNNNSRQSTHEEIWEREIYLYYYISSYKIIVSILLSLIDQKKLSYVKLRRILLRHTSFGINHSVHRGNYDISYCWFDKVDHAFKDFLCQLKNTTNKRPTDWRTSITMMTLQFESILRNIVEELGNGSIKQHGREKKEIREMLLDDLLNVAEKLKPLSGNNYFSQEDIYLFKYTFTNKGFNIRNNIAHGFYVPQDYTCEKAVLVFLCLMRLVKFHNK